LLEEVLNTKDRLIQIKFSKIVDSWATETMNAFSSFGEKA